MYRKSFLSNQEIQDIISQQNVKDFFNGVKQIRKGSGEIFEAPPELYTLIVDRIKEFSKLYLLVAYFFPIDKTPGNIIIGKDVTAAEFLPDDENFSPENFAINVTFEYGIGNKVGKVIFIPNDILDQHPEEFEAYIVKEMSRAIALALDDGILNGQGKDYHQLDGIIQNIPEGNIVDVTPTALIDILKPINKVDSGKYNDNEIVAVVNRNTYYLKLLELLLDCSNPGALPQFICCHAMPENKILYADLSKYILIPRGIFKLDRSRHARFIYDETGYKGRMFFDGTPGRAQAFTLVNLQ